MGLLPFCRRNKVPSPETTVGRLLETFPVDKYNIPILGENDPFLPLNDPFRLVIQKMGS